MKLVGAACGMVLGVAAYAQPVWAPTGGPEGGRLTDEELVGDVLFVGARSGLARSTDAGATWEILDLGRPVSVLDIEAVGGTVVVAVDPDQLLASPDNGETWHDIPAPAGGDLVLLTASGDRLYALAEVDGTFDRALWATDSMGQSWEQLPAPVSIYSLHADGDVLVAGTLSFTGFARSDDGGHTWHEGQSPDFGLPQFADLSHFESLPDGTLLLASASLFSGSSADNAVWRSVDDGASWTRVGVGQLPDDQGGADLRLSDSGLLLVTDAGTAHAWRSTDGGDTWDPLGDLDTSSMPHPRTFRIRETAGALCVGTSWLGVIRSDDDGATWERSNRGLGLIGVRGMASGAGGVWAGTGGGDVWRFDAGWSVSTLPGGFQRLDTVLESAEGTVFAATGYDGIFRSFDGGQSWVASNNGVPTYNGTAGEQQREVGAFVEMDGDLYAGLGLSTERISGVFRTTGGGAIRSTDGGQSWQLIKSGLPVQGRDNFNRPYYDPMLSGVYADGAVYMGMYATGVYRWSAEAWEFAGQGLPSSPGGVYSMTADDSYLYCGVNGAVYRRALEENAWTPTGAVPGTVYRVLARGDGVYASSFGGPEGAGVYISVDRGATWTRYGDGFPAVAAGAIVSRCAVLYAGTSGLGVWAAPVRCPGDIDSDGQTTTLDVLAFLNMWSGQEPCADFNADGAINTLDVLAFLNAWGEGC